MHVSCLIYHHSLWHLWLLALSVLTLSFSTLALYSFPFHTILHKGYHILLFNYYHIYANSSRYFTYKLLEINIVKDLPTRELVSNEM